MNLKNWIRKALTKREVQLPHRGKKAVVDEVPPSEKLVYAVVFAIAAMGILTALEVAHMILLGTWNSEVFAGIMSAFTFVVGVFMGKTA